MSARGLELLSCALIVSVLALPGASAPALGLQDAQAADDGKEWTILVYWDSDNDLEPCAEFAMETWKPALTCDDEVNLVVFMDLFSVSGTWIYDIHDGEAHTVETWDELNCSDPAVLERCLDYGLAN